MAHKLIGEVVSLTGLYAGTHIIRAYRTPGGRKLRETRILVQDGKPFTSRLAALDMLNQYVRGRLNVRAAKQLAPPPKRVVQAHSEPKTPIVNTALDYSHDLKKRRTKTRRANPEVVKLMPVTGPSPRAYDDPYGDYPIMRCPDARQQRDSQWGPSSNWR